MKLINANTFMTSLITLTAIAIPVASNAQSVHSNCTNYQKDDYQIDVRTDTESICIQDAVETIYNPEPIWQPKL